MTINVKSLMRQLAIIGALAMIAGLVAANAATASVIKNPIWSSNESLLPYGEEASFSGSSLSGLNLKWTSTGIPIWVQCERLTASGKVQNSGFGKPGTLRGESATFQGCRVVQVGESTAENGTTCHIEGEEIPAKIESGELTNTPYANGGLKLSGLSMTFYIKGCPGGLFSNQQWRVSGKPTGNEGLGAWPGEVLFPAGSAVTINEVTPGEAEFGLNVQGSGSTPIKIVEEEVLSTPGHHYWYTGGGQRKGEGAATQVASGSPLAIAGSGNSLTLEAVISGITTQFSCSGGSTSGSVENPAGEKDGVATASFGFTGCTVVKPEKSSCVIEGGSISTKTLNGSLSAGSFKFVPSEGAVIATFNVTGCTKPSLNGKYNIEGSLFASPYREAGTPAGFWSIPSSLNNSGLLKLRGQQATPSGKVAAETSKGVLVALS